MAPTVPPGAAGTPTPHAPRPPAVWLHTRRLRAPVRREPPHQGADFSVLIPSLTVEQSTRRRGLPLNRRFRLYPWGTTTRAKTLAREAEARVRARARPTRALHSKVGVAGERVPGDRRHTRMHVAGKTGPAVLTPPHHGCPQRQGALGRAGQRTGQGGIRVCGFQTPLCCRRRGTSVLQPCDGGGGGHTHP